MFKGRTALFVVCLWMEGSAIGQEARILSFEEPLWFDLPCGMVTWSNMNTNVYCALEFAADLTAPWLPVWQNRSATSHIMSCAIIGTNDFPEYIYKTPRAFTGFAGERGFYRITSCLSPRGAFIDYTNCVRFVNDSTDTVIEVEATFGIDWSFRRYGPVSLPAGGEAEWQFGYALAVPSDTNAGWIMDWSSSVDGQWVAQGRTNKFWTSVMGFLRPITAVKFQEGSYSVSFPEE